MDTILGQGKSTKECGLIYSGPKKWGKEIQSKGRERAGVHTGA